MIKINVLYLFRQLLSISTIFHQYHKETAGIIFKSSTTIIIFHLKFLSILKTTIVLMISFY